MADILQVNGVSIRPGIYRKTLKDYAINSMDKVEEAVFNEFFDQEFDEENPEVANDKFKSLMKEAGFEYIGSTYDSKELFVNDLIYYPATPEHASYVHNDGIENPGGRRDRGIMDPALLLTDIELGWIFRHTNPEQFAEILPKEFGIQFRWNGDGFNKISYLSEKSKANRKSGVKRCWNMYYAARYKSEAEAIRRINTIKEVYQEDFENFQDIKVIPIDIY